MTLVLDPVSQTQISEGTVGLTLKPSKAPSSLTVRCINSVDQLEAIKRQWNELAENSVWRNPSFEHNFLIPAFKHIGDGNVRVLVVEGATANDKNTLFGLMPIVRKKIYHLPIPAVEVWRHDQCCDSTPLIAKTNAAQTLGCVLDFLSEQKIGLLSLNTISAEPEFQSVLEHVIGQRDLTMFHRDSFARAALRPAKNSDDYVQRFVSKSVKKNYGRLKRRLAELGEVSHELSDEFSDYQELTRQFLEIESSGWKIESGTALACNQSTKDFYEELISRSSQVGKARFVSLKLDGKPIAILSDIQSGQTVSSYKTAFDEHYSAFSPGLQVEIKNIQFMHQTGIELADSCTDPGNATINRIWGQRLQFQSVVIGLQPSMARLATRLMPWIQAAANKIKQFRS